MAGTRAHTAPRPALSGAGTLLDARGVAVLLGALTLARFAVAAYAPLAPDEAYYWVWSHALAPGYLDAPPMVALWIRAGTAIAGEGALGIRLLGPVAALLGSVLLWDAADRLVPGRRAGPCAVALLNAMLLFGAGAALMTPDTPLLFFWTCCLWALARFLAARRGLWLVLAGLFAGLAFDSKYTAALLAPAVLLWLAIVPELRVWLVRPALWLGALLGGLAVAPVIAWNAAHGWASFLKQGGRIEDFRPDNALRFLGELAAGQAGLATPLVFALCVAGGVLSLNLGVRRREPGWALLALLTLIPALLFIQHAFGDRVQANWPAILYPAGVIAAAGLQGRLWVRLRAPAVGLGLLLTAIVYVQAAAAPFPLPIRADPTALKLGGWKEFAAKVDAARRAAGASFVAADEYGLAAELAQLLPASVPVIAVGSRWRLFSLPRPDLAGDKGILVRNGRPWGGPDPAPWSSIRAEGRLARERRGKVIEPYKLYLVVGRNKERAAEAVLPNP